ncbi:MAG TPA: metallopeptidase TldD-related protein [Gaiellaceae bacterium]|nr:metallopeptidase TldD-related protein [Gaiellaceae bacterium]
MRDAPAALELAERACRAVAGGEADVLAHRERSGFARFAASVVHQPTLVDDASVTIRVVRDGKVGAVSTNRTDDEGLRAAARRAAEAADRGRVDPSFPGLPPPAPLPDVKGFDEAVAALTPEEQAERSWRAIEAAGNLNLYGYFTSAVSELAVASTTGVTVSQALTDATVVALAADDETSGYADATAWRLSDLDPAAAARAAAETAERTRGARELGPGTYRAVLAPDAFGDLLWYFGFSSLGALAFLEGRSFFSGRLGHRVFDPSFSLVDDALDPDGLPKAFDFEGVPKQRVELVAGGVARDVVWDSRTGARAGKSSTGHALAAPAQAHGPLALNLAVAGGDATPEDLAERVGDGIYVSRLHYLSVVDAREAIFTGMTRDGTFRVERGRITEPLVNLRFTTSFPALAERLLGLSRERKLVNQSDFYGERYPYGALVPAVATEHFTIVGTGSRPGL